MIRRGTIEPAQCLRASVHVFGKLPMRSHSFGNGLLAALVLFCSAAAAQQLPPGVTPCALGGYSIDMDRHGAHVRSAPARTAPALGRLAPPVKAGPKDEAEPGDGLWRTTFRIIGFKDGWFLIEKAQHPFDDPQTIADRGRRSTGGVKTYAGRGWIAAGLVGGQYANAGLPAGALFAEPHEQATRLPARTKLGAPISADGGPKKVLACQGEWVKVESYDGVVGWWKTLCASQVTNCS